MRTLTDQLSQYAEYHRDRRNIATHFVGIPLIVLAIAALLSRPAWPILSGVFTLTPAWVLFALTTLFYLWLDVPLGIGMGVVSALAAAFGHWAASRTTSVDMARDRHRHVPDRLGVSIGRARAL